MAFLHQLINRTLTLPHVPSVSRRLDRISSQHDSQGPKRARGEAEQMRPLYPAAAAAAAKSLQSCLTLCDPIDCSPRGFPVPGILQARTLE